MENYLSNNFHTFYYRPIYKSKGLIENIKQFTDFNMVLKKLSIKINAIKVFFKQI